MILPHLPTNFEQQRFYGFHSRDDLLNETKDEVYGIKVNEYDDVGTH